jgi:uncharacterized protein YegJ (DUF2314 family)
MKVPLIALVAAAWLAGCGDASREPRKDDDTSEAARQFRVHDPEMNMAIRQARIEINRFRERLQAPTPTQVAGLIVKVGTGRDAGYAWLSNVEIDGDGFTGTTDEIPPWFETFAPAKRITVTVDDVVDWYVADQGIALGAFVLRIVRYRLPPEERDEFDQDNGFVAN